MSNTILIPTPLRPYVDKQESVQIAGKTVGEALTNLTQRYGDLRRHLYTDEGRLRSFVNVYLNDEDIRYLQRESTPLNPGDTLSIVPSVAAGSPAVDTSTSTPTPADLPTLTPNDIARYTPHLILPAPGRHGHPKLKPANGL